MRLEGAIFDLDGTLTDSMYVWDWVPGELLRRHGRRPPADLPKILKTMSGPEAAEYLIQTFALEGSVEEIMAEVAALADREYRERVPLKPGAAALLDRLAEENVPCCVATASEAEQAEAALRRLGVWHRFRFVLSASQYGSKTGPAIYLAAARRLGGAPERILVFEDALHAAQAAKSAGFPVAGVYDPSAREDWPALTALCDYGLTRLDDWESLKNI